MIAAAAPMEPAAGAQADVRELTVPGGPLRHFSVEYPGYVADRQRALQTLGGADGIACQLKVGCAAAAGAQEGALSCRGVSLSASAGEG